VIAASQASKPDGSVKSPAAAQKRVRFAADANTTAERFSPIVP